MGKSGYDVADEIIGKCFEILWTLTKKGFKKIFEKNIDVKKEAWRRIFENYNIGDKFGNYPILTNITCHVGGTTKKTKKIDFTSEKYTFISKITFNNIIKHKEQLETLFNRELEFIQKSLNSFEISKKDILAKKTNEIEKILLDLGIAAKLFKKKENKLSTIYYLNVDSFSKMENIKKELAFRLKQDEKDLRIIPEKGICKIIIRKQSVNLSFLDMYNELENEIKSKELPILYGLDNDGNAIIGDMKDSLNSLVGGSTGFGKSVFIHSVIISLLKAKENSLLYLFDPKGNELYDYANHKNVIFTDNKDHMLGYLVELEKLMRERNEKMKGKAKNIIEWNKTQAEKWPWLVIIIDEIADIMVETDENKERANDIRVMITKLSQMGRSAGIRLVLCTQKPNKEIVDTLIKANCITRISFKTANGMESRIILDKDEAQNLKKPGEMIALLNSEYKYIKAPYLSQSEIDKILETMK